jgi:DNA-binding XRE family transcriptional regulator
MDASFAPARAIDLHDFDQETVMSDADSGARIGRDIPHGDRATAKAPSTPDAAMALLHRGQVMLDNNLLRDLRQARLMSQQDLADDCWRRNIQVSIATIKRAEAGRAVRYRIARELARYFDLPQTQILLKHQAQALA